MKHSGVFKSVAVMLLALAVFIPAARCGWIWDDDHHITSNICLLTLHGLRQIWFHIGAVPQYYPVTHTTFWLEHHLWTNNPLGYHIDNILLHAANAVLIGWLLFRLKIPGAWLAAAIWAVHPVQVETVAWASERKNLLSGFFYLLSLHAAVRFWRIDSGEKQAGAGWVMWLACFGLFLLAILAKSVTASLPAVVLLLLWMKRRPITPRVVYQLLPFFVAAIGIGTLTGWMERHVVGAAGHDWDFSFWQRILIAAHSLWFYLTKLFWPVGQSFIYLQWPISPGQWIDAAALLGVMAGAWIFRQKLGRGTLAAILFFVGTLFPALGFVNVYPMRYSFVADHFQYLAILGPIALLAAVLSQHKVTAALAWATIIPLVFLTEIRIPAFHDARSLWTDVLSKNPSSDTALCNLAGVELAEGHSASAEDDLRQAIALNPSRVENQVALGRVYESEGRLAGAVAQFKIARTIDPSNPLPLFYLAEAMAFQGDVAAAISDYHLVASQLPNPAAAYNQAGQLEMQAGDDTAATADFLAAVAADPNLPAAYANLSSIALAAGRIDAAMSHAAEALAIDPDEVAACNNMGIALFYLGHQAEAIDYFRHALRVDPNSAVAKNNLRRLGG